MSTRHRRLEHGFSIATIIIVIILLFGVRYGAIVVPQIRQTADKVANLNNLQQVDIKFKWPCGFVGTL